MSYRIGGLESSIETKGLRKAAILAALYNAASKIGLGKKNPGPDTITKSEAAAILAANPHEGFDYLNGKRLKIDLSEAEQDGFIADQYEYGQGRGTAAQAIAILRETGDPCHPKIIALQQQSRIAGDAAAAPLPGSGTTREETLADALGIIDWGTAEEPDREYEDLKKIPCTTITL